MRLQERNSAINNDLNRLKYKLNDFILTHQADLLRFLPETINNFVLGIEEKTEIGLLCICKEGRLLVPSGILRPE